MSSAYRRGNAVTRSVWPRSLIEDSFFLVDLYAMWAAIECAGTALPNFTDAVTATAHNGTFSYRSAVSYSCPAASRFEDGRTDMLVTCSDYGWSWPGIVTSCARMIFFHISVNIFHLRVYGRRCFVFSQSCNVPRFSGASGGSPVRYFLLLLLLQQTFKLYAAELTRSDILWLLAVSHILCTANRCAPVPVAQHAVPDSYLAVQGSVVHYTCINGFTPLAVSPQSTACDGVNWAPTQLPGCESKQKTLVQVFQSCICITVFNVCLVLNCCNA